MSSEDLKRIAANTALEQVLPKLGRDSIIGIGTGSTANCFIDLLAEHRGVFDAAVASSDASAARLRQHGVTVIDLNAAASIVVYIDGADEVDPRRRLIKGGGAYINDERISDMDMNVTNDAFTNGFVILKAGKKNIKKVTLKKA